jgi:hypothetical protein
MQKEYRKLSGMGEDESEDYPDSPWLQRPDFTPTTYAWMTQEMPMYWKDAKGGIWYQDPDSSLLTYQLRRHDTEYDARMDGWPAEMMGEVWFIPPGMDVDAWYGDPQLRFLYDEPYSLPDKWVVGAGIYSGSSEGPMVDSLLAEFDKKSDAEEWVGAAMEDIARYPGFDETHPDHEGFSRWGDEDGGLEEHYRKWLGTHIDETKAGQEPSEFWHRTFNRRHDKEGDVTYAPENDPLFDPSPLSGDNYYW